MWKNTPGTSELFLFAALYSFCTAGGFWTFDYRAVRRVPGQVTVRQR